MDDLTSPSERHPVSPEKLSELTQLLTSCWEDVVTHRLVHPENEVSLRRTIASRIISAWEHGIDDIQELRRRALQDIVLGWPSRDRLRPSREHQRSVLAMSKIAGGIILAALFLAALPWLLISASAVIRFVLLTLLVAGVIAYVGWLIAGSLDSYLALIAIAGLMLGVWMIIDWVET
jgi:hypothetical protein